MLTSCSTITCISHACYSFCAGVYWQDVHYLTVRWSVVECGVCPRPCIDCFNALPVSPAIVVIVGVGLLSSSALSQFVRLRLCNTELGGLLANSAPGTASAQTSQTYWSSVSNRVVAFDSVGLFMSDLTSQSLEWCKKPVFSANCLDSTSKQNLNATKLWHETNINHSYR